MTLTIRQLLSSLWQAARAGIVIGVLLYLVCAVFNIRISHASGRAKPAPVVVVTPMPSPSASPEPVGCGIPGKPFVMMGDDVGPNVNRALAEQAFCLINEAVASGCVRAQVEAKIFKTLERDMDPQLARDEAKKAWLIYAAGAPYALDLRWYYKGLSKVIGYTYFYRDNIKGNPSETRIWSNTKYIGSDPKPYASHLMHELSHESRAGAFGHWSTMVGSFPYGMNEAADACL